MLQNKHAFQLPIIPLSTQSVEDAFVGVGRAGWLHWSLMECHVRPWELPGKGMFGSGEPGQGGAWVLIQKHGSYRFSCSGCAVFVSGRSLVPSHSTWNGDNIPLWGVPRQTGKSGVWGGASMGDWVGKVWRPTAMWPVVKQIRTWSKSKEDFNKGTFVLDLKIGSLWIYLQGKQDLLNE